MASARLLTGDKTLRTRTEGEGILVSGVLFIFDELMEHGIITQKEAIIDEFGLEYFDCEKME